jgi:hypothetical protein
MKAQWTVFAIEIAKGLSNRQAYKIAYPSIKDDKTADAAAARLVKRPEIQNEIVRVKNDIVKAAEQSAIEDIKEQTKFKVLSFNKKREILYNIATGKKTPAIERDGSKSWRYPTDQDKIRAIELDMEMTGEGWRPPEPPQGGTTVNGPVFNTVVRKTVFKTRVTVAQPQNFQNPANE